MHSGRPRNVNSCRIRRRVRRSEQFAHERKYFPIAAMQAKRFWFARLVRRIGKFAIDVRSVSQIDRYIAHFQKYSLFDQVISGRSGDGCVPKGAGHLLPLLDDEALLNKRRSIRNIKSFQVCDFSWFSRKATGGQGKAAVKYPLTYLDYTLSSFKACALTDPLQHAKVCGEDSTALRQLLDNAVMTYIVWQFASARMRRVHRHTSNIMQKFGCTIVSWLLDSGANGWLVPLKVG